MKKAYLMAFLAFKGNRTGLSGLFTAVGCLIKLSKVGAFCSVFILEKSSGGNWNMNKILNKIKRNLFCWFMDWNFRQSIYFHGFFSSLIHGLQAKPIRH